MTINVFNTQTYTPTYTHTNSLTKNKTSFYPQCHVGRREQEALWACVVDYQVVIKTENHVFEIN